MLPQYALLVSLASGTLLALLAATTRSWVAAAIAAASVSARFGVSACTTASPGPHCPAPHAPADHAMIVLLIAGTSTRSACWSSKPPGHRVLVVVWGEAAAGIGLQLAGRRRPAGSAGPCTGPWLGGGVAMPQLFARLGVAGGLLLVAGGLAASAGAAVSARRRPDPAAAVFGYHQVFHCW